METRWLNPTPELLCGLLWEERRSIRRIEVEFLPGGATAPSAEQLRLVTRTAAAPFEEASAPGFGLGPQTEFTLKPVADPIVTSHGATVFNFASQNDINSVKVLYSGSDPKVGVPMVRAFGRASWKKPMTVEIQWAFLPHQAGRRCDGRVEVYNGYIGRVTPLSSGGGVEAIGEHAWKDGQGTTARRGIKLQVIQTAGDVNSRTIVTIRTSCGNVSFAPRDLESGPILIPSVGIYIANAQQRPERRTVPDAACRQASAHGPSAGAGRARGELGIRHETLPWEKGAAGVPQTTLRAGHADRRTREAACRPVAIGRLASEALVAESEGRHLFASASGNRAGGRMGYTAIGLETSTNIRALDLMGSADAARGGLNWWLFFVKHIDALGQVRRHGRRAVDGPRS